MNIVVEGFDEMLLQAVQSIDNHEQLNQTEPQTDQNLQVSAQQHEPEPVPAEQSEPNLHVDVPQTVQNLKVPARHDPNLGVPDEQHISTTTFGWFKQLDADALLEITVQQELVLVHVAEQKLGDFGLFVVLSD
jgi:hypothetical protein